MVGDRSTEFCGASLMALSRCWFVQMTSCVGAVGSENILVSHTVG